MISLLCALFGQLLCASVSLPDLPPKKVKYYGSTKDGGERES